MKIEELKELSKIDLTSFVGNEQNVKYNIVLPFLNYFGYDTLDLEHAAQGSRIDINIGNKIIIETKALNKNLDDYVNQVKKYCNTERPNLAILTNGESYRFYSPFMRVSSFSDTLIYEFSLTDFSDDEVIERITKIIGADNYKNDTYLNYIEERENEIKQIKDLLRDYEDKKFSDIKTIKKDIEQLRSEITTLESNINLKQKEIEQINSKKIPEKEELYRKHFIPQLKPTYTTPTSDTEPQDNIPDSSKMYEIINLKTDVKAKGRYLDNKRFIVFAGSTVSNKLDDTFGKGVADRAYRIRKELEDLGTISINRELTEDYTFNSISQAACVVLGGSRSGPKEWK